VAKKKKWLLPLLLQPLLLKPSKTLVLPQLLLVLPPLLVLLLRPLQALPPLLVLLLTQPKVLLTPLALLLLKPPRRQLTLLLPLSRSPDTPALSPVSQKPPQGGFFVVASERYPVSSLHRVSNANIIQVAAQGQAQCGAGKVGVIVLQAEMGCDNSLQAFMGNPADNFGRLLVRQVPEVPPNTFLQKRWVSRPGQHFSFVIAFQQQGVTQGELFQHARRCMTQVCQDAQTSGAVGTG